MTNYVNPYMNPYTQPYANYQQPMQQIPQQQVVKVNGENGARAYQMGANSSAWLLDESGLVSWLVISDGAGYKTVTPYDVSPHQVAKPQDYSNLENRISRLEEMVNANSANTTTTTRKTNKSSNAIVDSSDQ